MLALIIRIYHNAQSSECQILQKLKTNGTWILIVYIRSLTPSLNHWHITKTSIIPTQNLKAFSQKNNKTALKTVLLPSVDLHLWIYSDEAGSKFSSASLHFHYWSHFFAFHCVIIFIFIFTRNHHNYTYFHFGSSIFLWNWHRLLLLHQITAMINYVQFISLVSL